MAVELGRYLTSIAHELRFEPVGRRIRAAYRGDAVLDTTDAILVWEPRRVVPMYAVPPADISARLEPCDAVPPPSGLPPALGPEHFEWHLHPGDPLRLAVGGTAFPQAAFRPADPDLGGRIIVDWSPFEWTEEAQPVTGHPHDPFKRLDLLPSDRHVVVSLNGQLLADTLRPVALYETSLPVRWYLPRDDVRMDLLMPSRMTSVCAYKGQARYLSLTSDPAGADDIAWTYPEPLHEAEPIRDLICFYAERTDLVMDGVPVARPRTLWSRPGAEAGPSGG